MSMPLARQVERNTVSIEELRALVRELARAQLRTEESLRRFQEEMRAAQERAEQERREMNRRWGELANKMGTLAEDLVAPSIPRILQELVGCSERDIQFAAVRVRKQSISTPGRVKEFDVVVVCGEYVLINETKSSLRPNDVDQFVKTLEEIRDFFPEYKDKKFIGAIATLYMTSDVLKYAERKGLVALGFGENVMDVLNQPGFKPKVF